MGMGGAEGDRGGYGKIGPTKLEATFPPLSPEIQKIVEQMRTDGYAVYDTAGKTPISLKLEGMRYSYFIPNLDNVTATPSLLAFKHNPSEFFLKGSKRIPHEKQLELLLEEQASVDKQYPDEGLIVREGKLPEWTELVLRHFKETSKSSRGVRIFGKHFDYAHTWTCTYGSDQLSAHRARVGGWNGTNGMFVNLSRPDLIHYDLGLAPVVEIPRKR